MKTYNLCKIDDWKYIDSSKKDEWYWLYEFPVYAQYEYFYTNEKGLGHCLTGPAVKFKGENRYQCMINGLSYSKEYYFQIAEVRAAIEIAEYLEKRPELEGFL